MIGCVGIARQRFVALLGPKQVKRKPRRLAGEQLLASHQELEVTALLLCDAIG
jgi:hypothetical protein